MHSMMDNRSVFNRVAVATLAFLLPCSVALGVQDPPPATSPKTDAPTKSDTTTDAAASDQLDWTYGDGLVIEDLEVGTGDVVRFGAWPSFHYKGMLTDGRVFFDSRANGNVHPQELFLSEVLMEGWVRGLPGMRVGGKRRITMPPMYGYQNVPPKGTIIQPGDTVVMEFEAMKQESLPEAKLSMGMELRRLREGEGEGAKYGDWVTFHLRVFIGEELRAGLDTMTSKIGAQQIALPSPPGVFTGSAHSMLFNLPYLDMLLYGIKEGERRDAFFPTSKVFGPVGEPRIGVKADEPFTVELECVKIDRGPDVTLNNGLRIQDLIVGDGRYAHMGVNVHFYYRGMLEDGTVIESNWDDSKPMITRLYNSRLLAGIRLGLQGMRVGGERRLYIPAALAFGQAPPDEFSQVPPNADVIYEVKLVNTLFPR